MAEQEMKWGIYIEYGTEKEFEAVRKAKFPSKKRAIYWCQNPSQNKTGYHYPIKCVMRIEEILKSNPDYYSEEITESQKARAKRYEECLLGHAYIPLQDKPIYYRDYKLVHGIK
jgi:hypothetical protein